MASLPLLCVLIALPFASATAIALVPELHRLAADRPRVTWPVGAAGLALLLAGLLGALPQPVALPLMVVGGLVSGFSVFWPVWEDGEDSDEPPFAAPEPGPDGGPDWGDFDRLRADWEREEPSITRIG